MPPRKFDNKLDQLAFLVENLFAEELPVDEKLRELSDLLDQPLDEAHDGRTDLLDPEFIAGEFRRMWPLDLYFRPDLLGAENLPKEGGAVVVSNHVVMAIDTMLLSKKLFEETGRLLRPTVDKLTIRFPYFREYAFKMGCVTGRRENAVALARAGELVLSYPGGAREALKSTKRAYELLWEGATGFVKVALAAQVPIVPVASVGGDESYATLSEETSWTRRLTGSLRYVMPFYWGMGPFPMPVKFLFAVGEPIDPGLPASAADDEQAVAEVQDRVRRSLERLLDETRLRRGSSIFG